VAALGVSTSTLTPVRARRAGEPAAAPRPGIYTSRRAVALDTERALDFRRKRHASPTGTCRAALHKQIKKCVSRAFDMIAGKGTATATTACNSTTIELAEV
jgi:hypothetical protein